MSQLKNNGSRAVPKLLGLAAILIAIPFALSWWEMRGVPSGDAEGSGWGAVIVALITLPLALVSIVAAGIVGARNKRRGTGKVAH